MRLITEKIEVFKIRGKDFDMFVKNNYKEFGLSDQFKKSVRSWDQINEMNDECDVDTHVMLIDQSGVDRVDKVYKRDGWINMLFNDDNYVTLLFLMLYLFQKGYLEEGYYYFSE